MPVELEALLLLDVIAARVGRRRRIVGRRIDVKICHLPLTFRIVFSRSFVESRNVFAAHFAIS